MNILVTGGAGFIGSHIVDALVKKGYKVSVIDNLSGGSKDNLNPEVTFYEKDITKDISDIFDKERPEVVFHLAAHIDLRESVKDPIFDANSNIIGTLNILENMKRVETKKIIFSSSSAVYGDVDKIPTSEEEKEKPNDPYGISKLSIEKYMEFYKKVYGIDFVSLRYANAYGPRQNPKGEAGVIAIFTDRMLGNGQPMIHGTGEHTRDYLFVKDIVKANIMVFEKNVSGIFNASTMTETSVNNLFRKLKILTGSNVKEVHDAEALSDRKRCCLTYDKLKKEVGWEPDYDIDKGLKETVEWFKSKK